MQRGAGNRPSSLAASLRDGDLFVDRYLITRTAAFGGMSRIYEAQDVQTGRPIALKVLSLPNVDPLYTQRFEREIRILRTLVHPNLVRAHDNGSTHDGTLYLALEWLTGQDLGQRLKSGKLPPRTSCEIVLGSLRGLDAVHDSGVVHRDLKPANIFLQADAVPPDGVKLLDFGVAKLVEDHMIGSYQRTLTTAGMVVGTPFYMAPEQAQGAQTIDHRADLFSLGAVLFECICGKRPFVASSALALLVRIASEDAPSIREFDPSVSDAVDDFLSRALARDPNDRFQTAREMEDALEEVIDDLDLEAPTIFAKLPDSATDPSYPPGEGHTQANVAEHTEDSIDDGNITIRTLRPFPAQDTLQPSQTDVDNTIRQSVDAVVDSATVLVADLSGVSDGSDGLFSDFEKVIERQGGRPLPVRGGVAIGVFSSIGGDDQSLRAVRAGLAVLRMDDDAERHTRAGAVRAAVATGSIYDTELDGEPDAIDAACSLLEYAEPTELVLDDVTLELASSLIEAKPRGEHVHVVTGAIGSGVVPAAPGGRTASAPFVGREKQLETLITELQRAARTREPRCALLIGEPGVGKSRLRHELESLITELNIDASIMIGHGDLATKSLPFSLFADALRRRGVIRGGEAPDVLLDKLDKLIPATVPQAMRPRARRELATLMGLPIVDERSPTTPEGPAEGGFADRTLGVRVRGTLMDTLQGHAKDRPLILLLDDTQWSDSTSMGVVLDLIRSDDAPVFVLVSGRPDLLTDHAPFVDALEGVGRHTRIDLGNLDAPAAREMAISIMGGDVSDELFDSLMRRTRGNPYYLEEMVLSFASENIEADVTETDMSLGERLESVTGAVDDVVRKRLKDLPSGQRRLLEHAAIFGGTFWDQGLVALGCDRPKDELQALIAGDFIEVRDTSRYAGAREYRFRSHVARDVAYDQLDDPQRRKLHQFAADYLEVAGESDSVTIARHLAPAGDSLRALRRLIDGARHALASGDADAAETIVSQGIEIAGVGTANRERISLLEVQQEALERLGRYDEALASVDTMASLDPGDASLWRTATRRGTLLIARGDSSGALRSIREAIEADARRGSAGLPAAWLALGLGDALQERGDTFTACTHYQQAYSAAKTHNSAHLVARGVLRLGRIAYATSDFGQAERLFRDASRRFGQELEDQRAEAQAQMWLGAVLVLAGNAPAGLEAIESAATSFEAVPDHLGLLMARAYRAMALSELGKRDDCNTQVQSLNEELSSSQTRHPMLLCGLVSLRALLDAGRHSDAADFARHLFESAVRSLPRFVVPIESALGIAIAKSGDPQTGLRHAEAAVARLESQKASEDEDPQRVYVNYAEALELAGAHPRAQQVWHQAATTMVEVESRLTEGLRGPFRQRAINHKILKRTGTPRPPMHQP